MRKIDLFHSVMNRLEVKKILGHYILMSFIELPVQEAGIGGVVEKIHGCRKP